MIVFPTGTQAVFTTTPSRASFSLGYGFAGELYFTNAAVSFFFHFFNPSKSDWFRILSSVNFV